MVSTAVILFCTCAAFVAGFIDSIAGNWLGSRLAIKVGTEAVRRFLWVSLSLLLATLVWRFFISPHLPGA